MNKRIKHLLQAAAVEAAEPLIEAFAAAKLQISPTLVRDTLRSVVASFAEGKKVSMEATASAVEIPYIASGDLIATAYAVYTQGDKRNALQFVLQAFEQDDMESLADALTHANESADNFEQQRDRALLAASGDEDDDIAPEDDGDEIGDDESEAVDIDAEDDGGDDMLGDGEDDGEGGEESDDEIIDSVIDGDGTGDDLNSDDDANDAFSSGEDDDDGVDEIGDDEDDDSEITASDDADDDGDEPDPLPQQKKEGMGGTRFPTMSASVQRAVANKMSIFGDDESRKKASDFLAKGKRTAA